MVAIIFYKISYTNCIWISLSTARTGSRILQQIPAEKRASCINTLADLLVARQKDILEANQKDLNEAQKNGTAKPLLSRLSLTPAKLKNLAVGKCENAYLINTSSSINSSNKIDGKSEYFFKTRYAFKNLENDPGTRHI